MESENTSKIIKAHGGADHTLLLPEEIIEEILSRLPVKSLLRFRCVSKCWRSVIGSSRFIKAHLENSTKNPNLSHHRIILNLNPSRSSDRLKHCSLPSLLNNPIIDTFEFGNSIDRFTSIRLVGSCNGLVCILLERKEFILWNPSIKMSKKLPDVDGLWWKRFFKYGFGYDASKGDYKVFAVLSSVVISFGSYVYSLKANSWGKRRDRDASPFDEVGKFVSGSLYWIRGSRGYGYGYGDEWDIDSFDLEREVYGMVEKPSYSSEGGCVQTLLGMLGGCLCLLYDYPRTRADVWVMKQYGLRESWIKVVTLAHDQYPFNCRFFKPLCISPNGEIQLACGHTLVSYSPKDHVFRYDRIDDLDSSFDMDIYIESLVSLVSDGEQERQ